MFDFEKLIVYQKAKVFNKLNIDYNLIFFYTFANQLKLIL